MLAAQRVMVRCSVNGVAVAREVEPRMLLSDFIRHELDLTGTHVGCEHGVCGACTVVLDGAAVRSCLMLAVQANAATIETVESLAIDGQLSDLQEAFRQEQGLQCGFCTPGILMSLSACMRSGTADRGSMVDALGGHICRCTGYVSILRAVDRVLDPAASMADATSNGVTEGAR
jgi:aerobic-type carbon monoxide dehydrogenase small subunit (CoxS/CutS family)